MGSTGINVLVGIFVLVILMLVGLSWGINPQYQADDPRGSMYAGAPQR
jgi:hypothetical protein